MPDNDQDDSFSASKAEVFEALGHPTRIRILQTLSEKPLAFSELKRAVGLDSNGLLSFHLGKLAGLVRLNPEGAYALTDEGREALRIVDVGKSQVQDRTVHRPSVPVPHLKTVLAGLVVILIILAAASAIEYNQIQGLDSRTTLAPSTVTGTTTVTTGIRTTVISTATITGTSSAMSTVTSTVTATGPPNTVQDTTTVTTTSTSTTTTTATTSGVPSIGTVTATNLTISGGTTGGIATDPDTNMIYVAGPSGVTVIDGSSNQTSPYNSNAVVASVPIRGESTYLAVNPKTGLIYLNNNSCATSCTQSLVVLNGATNKVVGSINLGQMVYWIAVNPNTDTIYTGIDKSLFVVNGSTNSLIATVSLPGFMTGVAVDPKTDTVYVPTCTLEGLVCAQTDVNVIDGATQAMVSTIPAITGAIAVNPVTDTVYVTADNELVSINGTSHSVTYTELSAFPISCGAIAVDSGGNNVYVTCANGQNGGLLFIVDGGNNQVVNSFSETGPPEGVAFDLGNGEAYLVGHGFVLALLSTDYLPP